MSTPQSHKPSTTWCISFEVNDIPSRTYSGANDEHFVLDKLRAIYTKVNEKCSKTCKIPVDKIIFTQEDVEIHKYTTFF